MAWSPVRRINAGLVRVEAPGDYATLNSNQLRDATHSEGSVKSQPSETLFNIGHLKKFVQR
jgi:hypothetical protein